MDRKIEFPVVLAKSLRATVIIKYDLKYCTHTLSDWARGLSPLQDKGLEY